MSATAAIFWPMVAHAALVFGLYGLLGLRRAAMVRQGKARIEQFRENRDEPTESLVVRNNLANQFELPVLFHVCCLALYFVEADNLPMVALAWIFVVSRYAHSFVHVTGNRLSRRQPAFLVGFVTLGLMWAWFAVWLAMS